MNVCREFHVLAVVVPKAKLMLFAEICRGYVEEMILFVYAVFQFVLFAVTVSYEEFQFEVEAVSGILYRAVTPNTPVVELYVRLFVAESDVDEILLLNTVQSDEESRPREREDAVGMFSVCVEPVDVKPNPPLVDVVANV